LEFNQVTKDGMPPLPERDGGDLSAKENEIRLQSLIHEESQPTSEDHLQFSVPEHVVSPHVQDPMPSRDSRSELHMLRVPHLLEKGEGMPHLSRQIVKVP